VSYRSFVVLIWFLLISHLMCWCVMESIICWFDFSSIICWFGFWYNLDNHFLSHLGVPLLVYLVFLSKLYLVWFLKVFTCMFTIIYVLACLSFLIQYIGDTPPNPKSAKMCMKFNFISIWTYLCGCFLYIVVYLTTMGPNEFGNHFVL